MSAKTKFFCFLSPTAAVLALSGCGTVTPGGEFETTTRTKDAALFRAGSCEDLLSKMQADAIDKLDQQIAQIKRENRGVRLGLPGAFGSPQSSGDGDISVDEGSNGDGDGDGDAVSSPDLPSGEAGGDTPPGSFSETNTQVKDVDEADIVKVGDEGQRLYVLHGQQLKIVDSWPAEETHDLGSAAVSGTPSELFIRDGKAIVFSSVNPADLPVEETGDDLIGGDGDITIGDGDGDATGDAECFDCCYYGSSNYVQVTVFDVTGDTPALEREMIFEGQYISSRRHGDVVRAIVSGGFNDFGYFYPDFDMYDRLGNPISSAKLNSELADWRERVVQQIESRTVDGWLPGRFEKKDGAWAPIDPGCENYFAPDAGLVSGGITQVVTFDATDEVAPSVTSVLGGSEVVYASHTSLLIAQADYSWYNWREGEGSRTILHRFELDGANSNYDASGFVPGMIHNQFSIDESDSIIRLSTTEEVMLDEDAWDIETRNTVMTLKSEGGELAIVDRTDPMGEPGETIFATRFIGDRGYVVTFRQTDPLFAVDLSNPEDIQVLGELHIPGFSDYIHPMEDGSLLTIGMDADSSGITTGLALQIFDVSDPTAPALVHKEARSEYSYSEANHNHKAFTFVDNYFGEGEHLLLFPLVVYEENYVSSLEVYRVSMAGGFTSLGSIDHAALINQDCESYELEGVPCYYYGGDEMRRGVQIDEYIYALSQGGITVHPLSALADPALATIELAPPTFEACY